MSYSLKERLEKLNIKTEQITKLKNAKFKGIYIEDERLDTNKSKTMTIKLSKLAGISRPDAENLNNWIEALDYLHKMRNFAIYEPSSFNKIILNPPCNQIPEVIEYEGKFYIGGEGKHRLTMAKCLKIKEAKVIVTPLKK